MQIKSVKREFAFALPTVFISTRDAGGIRNIAPYGNLMPLLRSTDLVCVASWHKRDTLANIRETREFVINVPPLSMQDFVIPTARFYPPEVDEFEIAGLVARPSQSIRPPGIEGCLAWLECELVKQYIEKEYVLIVGRVKHFEIADQYLDDAGGLDPEKAQPLIMLLNGLGMRFTTVKEGGSFVPYGAMFPDGKDPLAGLFEE